MTCTFRTVGFSKYNIMPRLVDIGNAETFITKNRDMFYDGYDIIYDSGVSVRNCADRVFIVRCEIHLKTALAVKRVYFKIKYNSKNHSKEMQDILNCIDSLFQFRLFQRIINYLDNWYCGGFRYGDEFINFEQDAFITDYDVLVID